MCARARGVCAFVPVRVSHDAAAADVDEWRNSFWRHIQSHFPSFLPEDDTTWPDTTVIPVSLWASLSLSLGLSLALSL